MQLLAPKIPVFQALETQAYTIDTLTHIVSFFNIFLIDFNKKTAIFRKHCQIVKSYKKCIFYELVLGNWENGCYNKNIHKKITGGSEK
jgi:hypothetical protein